MFKLLLFFCVPLLPACGATPGAFVEKAADTVEALEGPAAEVACKVCAGALAARTVTRDGDGRVVRVPLPVRPDCLVSAERSTAPPATAATAPPAAGGPVGDLVDPYVEPPAPPPPSGPPSPEPEPSPPLQPEPAPSTADPPAPEPPSP